MKIVNLIFALALCLQVHSLQGQKKIILSNYNAQVEDAVIGSIAPTDNWGNEGNLDPYAWTQGGVLNVARPLIRFDLSSLPPGAKIEEALMVLYHDPFPPYGGTHAGLSSFSVSRIIEPWEELGVTWNNQPAITTKHQVTVPAAVYDKQNYVINITALVADILADSPTKNYGFMMRLDYELAYNAVNLASSDHADASRHPQLWITYKDGLVGTGGDALNVRATQFSVAPNPSAGVFSVTREGDVSATKYEAEMFDLQGTLVLKQPLAGSFSYLYANHLPTGTYILKIRSDAGYIQTEKIVLTK